MNSSKKNSKVKVKQKSNEFSKISEELSLQKPGFFKRFFSALGSKLSFLKKKKFWIPLVIFHICLFIGSGYYAHYHLTKQNSPDYIVSSLQKSFTLHDAYLFDSICDINKISDNFVSDFLSYLPRYKYVTMRMEEIPSTDTIRDHISLFLLDIIKGNIYSSDFNSKTGFIPKDFAKSIAASPLHIQETQQKDVYLISTAVYDSYWENIPIKLEVTKGQDGLKITKLANLAEILQLYNDKLSKVYKQKQNFQAIRNQKDFYNITQYLPNSACSAQLGYVNKKNIIFLDFHADTNFQKEDIIAFAVQINITNEDGKSILEKTIKSNRLFIPTKPIETSWQVPINEEQAEILKRSKKIICEVTPVMVNADNGDYFDIRKK